MPAKPAVIVVMGVSGCGKSTVGALAAQEMHCPFYEGDAYHPLSNIEKMLAGTPLTDQDRLPWLQQLAAIIHSHCTSGTPAVVSCSSLKPAYRDILCGGQPLVAARAAGGNDTGSNTAMAGGSSSSSSGCISGDRGSSSAACGSADSSSGGGGAGGEDMSNSGTSPLDDGGGSVGGTCGQEAASAGDMRVAGPRRLQGPLRPDRGAPGATASTGIGLVGSSDDSGQPNAAPAVEPAAAAAAAVAVAEGGGGLGGGGGTAAAGGGLGAATGGGSAGPAVSGVGFVLLEPSRQQLQRWVEARAAGGGHFMPASLLESQLATLEYTSNELFMRLSGDPFPEPQAAAAAVVRAWRGN